MTDKLTRDDLSYHKGLHRLPDHMRGGMLRYIEHGIPPGDFQRLVLSNDLMGALGRADDVNRHSLFRWGEYLYNDAPRGCWGSPENYAEWVAKRGLVGMGVIDDPGVSDA